MTERRARRRLPQARSACSLRARFAATTSLATQRRSGLRSAAACQPSSPATWPSDAPADPPSAPPSARARTPRRRQHIAAAHRDLPLPAADASRPRPGTRLFGADELFLLCSLSLGHRAATGEPLLQLDGSERERWWPALRAGWLLAVALLAVLTVRRPRWLAALGSFGLLCATAPWPLPCLVYGPALAVLLVTNAARAPRPCLACSRSSAHSSSTRTRSPPQASRGREYPPSSRTHTRGPGSARS